MPPSGIVDGQPVDAANSNPAWLAANGDDEALGKIGLNDQDPSLVSGDEVENTQRELNSFSSYVGKLLNTVKNLLPTWATSESFLSTDSLFARADKLSSKFPSATGHSHNPATAGDGGAIQAGYIQGAKLRALIQQGVNIIGATGVSSDISAQFVLKNPSTADSIKGVPVNTPYNKVSLQQASGASQGDSFYDGSGNLVYGRITYSAGVWTLSFYVLISSTETAYNFVSPVDIAFFYQEIFDQLTEGPVYSTAFFMPSENTTADVVDASPTQRGVVNTLTQVFAGLKVFSDGIDLDDELAQFMAEPVDTTDGANKNYVDKFGGTQFVATAGGTTNLTVTSARDLVPFGTLSQTFVLPSTALLQVGNWWRFVNRSTQPITVQNASLATVATVAPQTAAYIRVTSTGAETWAAYAFPIFSAVDGSLNANSGKIVNVANGTNPADAVNFAQLTAGAALPSQTGQAGRYLRTDGSAASWQEILNDSNFVIKGNFEMCQRTTQFQLFGSQIAYHADRFAWAAGTITGTVKSERIAVSAFSNSVIVPKTCRWMQRYEVQTAQASLSADSTAGPWYKIEGYDFAKLLELGAAYGPAAGLMIDFLVGGPAGVYTVELFNFGSDNRYFTTYTITSGGTWERKSIFISAADILTGIGSGTWNYTNSTGLGIRFWLAAGTNSQGATQNAWTGATPNVPAAQFNFLGTTLNQWGITALGVYVGATVPQFKTRGQTFSDEEELAKRYFEKSYDYGLDLASTARFEGSFTCIWNSGNRPKTDINFEKEKRTTPSIVIYNPQTGATGTLRTEVGPADITAGIDGTDTGSKAFKVYQAVLVSTYMNGAYGQYAADAEL